MTHASFLPSSQETPSQLWVLLCSTICTPFREAEGDSAMNKLLPLTERDLVALGHRKPAEWCPGFSFTGSEGREDTSFQQGPEVPMS